MLYYLLDSSAYVKAIIDKDKPSKFKHNFIDEAKNGNAFLYMPQFCVAEVLNVFAKLYIAPESKSESITEFQYKELCKLFRSQICYRYTIYIYDLHRYHNLCVDKLYLNELSANLRKKDKERVDGDPFKKRFVGGLDLLIIAMSYELRKTYADEKKDRIILLSTDTGLIEVANSFYKENKLKNISAENIFFIK